MPEAGVTFDWMVENVPWIIGSPEDCIAQVRELDEAVGGFGSLLFNSREWVTIDRWHRSLELFARYVSPHFRHVTTSASAPSSPPTRWENDVTARRTGFSLWSRNSFCSIASSESSFSIGSIGSFASVGSRLRALGLLGRLVRVFASVLSSMSALSVLSPVAPRRVDRPAPAR